MPTTPTPTPITLTVEQQKQTRINAAFRALLNAERDLAAAIDGSRERGRVHFYANGPAAAGELFDAYGTYGPSIVAADMLQRLLQAVKIAEPESLDINDIFALLLGDGPAGSVVPADCDLKVWIGETEVPLAPVMQALVLALAPVLNADRVTVTALQPGA